MKKILLFFLFLISIFTFAETSDKSPEEIMNEYREKIAKREQEKLRQEEEAEQKRQAEQEAKEKEAEKLMKEKRHSLISEPLVDKYYRAEDKSEASEKAMEVAESRMSFVRVKESINGEEENTLSGRYDDTYTKIQENSKKMEKALEKRKLLEKQLKELDELENKVNSW